MVNLQTVVRDRLQASPSQIQAFCQRWQIVELALFGSILRDDFRADSDIDVLITFAPNPTWTLFDVMNMQRELEHMLGRQVDLLEREELRNPYRKAEILKTYQVIYASQ
jgi:uncharacterized protein